MDLQQRESLEELVKDFSAVFSTNKQDLGHTRLIYHRIDTGDHAPHK